VILAAINLYKMNYHLDGPINAAKGGDITVVRVPSSRTKARSSGEQPK